VNCEIGWTSTILQWQIMKFGQYKRSYSVTNLMNWSSNRYSWRYKVLNVAHSKLIYM